ncbi:MAG: NAD(P)H-hydrate dehydratase [Henriciella sp.]|nr:NAD(P)H-hydrate dehydratase [Henriciella sp.]
MNHPDNWTSLLPRPSEEGHKYHRGHAVIVGATELTGATRLAAAASSRVGAGLVSVLSDEAADIYRMTLPADIMVKGLETMSAARVSAVLAGSGGISERGRAALLQAPLDRPLVLDAEAIALHQDLAAESLVLTPHDGEFARAFPDLSGERLGNACAAAKHSGAVIVLKGAETIVAEPGGRHAINQHASPYLAKAGTGDVLAGLITGLVAQGMPCFEAAQAAVWMHGEASLRIGAGLIAQDLISEMRGVLHDLLNPADRRDGAIE